MNSGFVSPRHRSRRTPAAHPRHPQRCPRPSTPRRRALRTDGEARRGAAVPSLNAIRTAHPVHTPSRRIRPAPDRRSRTGPAPLRLPIPSPPLDRLSIRANPASGSLRRRHPRGENHLTRVHPAGRWVDDGRGRPPLCMLPRARRGARANSGSTPVRPYGVRNVWRRRTSRQTPSTTPTRVRVRGDRGTNRSLRGSWSEASAVQKDPAGASRPAPLSPSPRAVARGTRRSVGIRDLGGQLLSG